MNKCPECGKELEDSAVFCSKCGTKLSVTCPKCGKVLKAGAKFCSVCGANLAESAKSVDSPTSKEEKRNLDNCSLEKLLAMEEQSHSAEVQLKLAKRYYKMPDYYAAFSWFTKSAEQGNADAQFGLGECYLNGFGTFQNYEESFKWYKKSAEQENAMGQYKLGDCYFYGWGTEKDKEEAFKWYKKAAEQGNENAKATLKNF